MNVLLFWEYRISMVFLLLYLLFFLSLKYDKARSLLIVAVSFLLTHIIEAGMFFGEFSTEANFVLLALEIATVQITAWVLSSYRDMRAIFTGVSAATYVLPGNLLYLGLRTFSGISHSVWLLLTPAGIHLLILAVSVGYLRDRYLREMENKSSLWNKMWVIPAFFYGIIYMLTMWSEAFFYKWQNWVAIIMILLLMDIVFIFLVRMVASYHEEEEVRTGKELLEVYASGLEGQTEELKKMEEEFRVMRHDNKYRYQVIRNCLNEGNYDQIRELLDQTGAEFNAISRRKFCKNVVIDGAVAVYYSRAQSQNIDFQWKIQMPDTLENLNEFEFATVIMNLLDNAVRCAAMVPEEDKRQVSIRIRPVKSQLLLEVRNTFTGEYQISKVTGLPLSERGTGHGFGMKSVQAYAGKYHGMFRYFVENQMFCVTPLTGI